MPKLRNGGIDVTKAQREKAERLMLKQMLDNNPKLKEVIDNLINLSNPELRDVIAPVIENQFKNVRMQGIMIGWISAWLNAYSKVKDLQTVDEIKALLRNESDKMRKQMKLDGSYFDDDGNIIIEDGDVDE